MSARPALLIFLGLEDEPRVLLAVETLADELRLRAWLRSADAPEIARRAVAELLAQTIPEVVRADVESRRAA